MNGYDKLIEKIKEDAKNKNCFNDKGCSNKVNKCSKDYCAKLGWIKDRAKHYAHYLDVDWVDIINAWEEKRRYWYMNFYQDINQPKLNKATTYVFDDLNDFHASITHKQFRCPRCGGVSTDPYECNAPKFKQDGKCNWNVNGLLGDLGKGAYVFFRDSLQGNLIFMPLDWEEKVDE